MLLQIARQCDSSFGHIYFGAGFKQSQLLQNLILFRRVCLNYIRFLYYQLALLDPDRRPLRGEAEPGIRRAG